MNRCHVKPYEGDEKYIFLSYCHKDKAYVFPIVEQLARDGYRIWYDEGIDPGSEWPEIIASHLNGCEVCIAFITENSLNSHNCRREINFALLKKKSFISVILEEVEMSLGMEMQLSATQSIYKYKLSHDQDFFKKLYDAQFLRTCLGEKNDSIVVSKWNDFVIESEDNVDLKRESFSDKWFIDSKMVSQNSDIEINKDSHIEEDCVLEKRQNDIDEDIVNEEDDIIQEVYQEMIESWLTKEKDKKEFDLPIGQTNIGRSSESQIRIVGNSYISRKHAILIKNEIQTEIMDNDSKNKTYLNEKVLNPSTRYILKDGDEIKVANERFIFHQITRRVKNNE